MPVDVSPLRAAAADLDRQVGQLHEQAALVTRAVAATCWTSPAARAWADSAESTTHGLDAGAVRAGELAAQLRRVADRLSR